VRNPFLPKRPIRWRAGAAKGKIGIPALPFEMLIVPPAAAETSAPYRKDPRGRKPKEPAHLPRPHKPATIDSGEVLNTRAYRSAGKLNCCVGPFLLESNAGWGSNLDMLALVHGPVGCGGFAQTTRLNLPGFVQGIETFTALHASTNLLTEDLDSGGDAKLARSLEEARTLFPLARGVTILNEDPIAIIDADVKGIARRPCGRPAASSFHAPAKTCAQTRSGSCKLP
jgi:nitrogenase molybdenum-iron protein alpha chain